MSNKSRICVCTPYPASAEPRGPRHARALAELFPEREIVFLDCAPIGSKNVATPALGELPNLRWITHYFPTKKNPIILCVHKLRARIASFFFQITGLLLPEIFTPRVIGIEKILTDLAADVYFPHNIELLLPTLRSMPEGSSLLFDCMEFYSDMGAGQTPAIRRAVSELESAAIPKCTLLTTSSPQVSAAYLAAYEAKKTLSLYNCPPRSDSIEQGESDPIKLYWRNSVLGLGQRGLEGALDALVNLPHDITLHLQGNLGFDRGATLKRAIDDRNLKSRVFLLPPHGPDEAVSAASPHTIGLCLEQSGVQNHELTVSNKIFDYMMSGLAVISSDLTGLSQVIHDSKGGLLFEPGSSESLANQILHLKNHPEELAKLRNNARSYALKYGNREAQMKSFKQTVISHI